MDLRAVGADNALTNEHSDHKHLQNDYNTQRTKHTGIYLKVMFILHQPKNLGAKDKFPVTTSVTVHLSKIVMLKKKKKKRKVSFTTTKDINTNKSTGSLVKMSMFKHNQLLLKRQRRQTTTRN